METIIKGLDEHKIPHQLDEPMARHTSFRIGGAVRAMVFPKTECQLHTALRLCAENNHTPFVFGNGSNLLVQDAPIPRIAIQLGDNFSKALQVSDTSLLAQSGILLSRLAVFAQKNALSGLEFAHGIPGTLGGAIAMNAGAYGGEMAQVVTRVRYFDENLTLQAATGNVLDFSYRHSLFSGKNFTIIDAEIALSPGNGSEIRAQMDDLATRRKSSQPLEKPSAGSTFKRPPNGYAAAMIDQAGLKGYQIGGAAVSEKHAGFIVNLGDATCDDVLRLIEHVQKIVYEQTGTMLETEVLRV